MTTNPQTPPGTPPLPGGPAAPATPPAAPPAAPPGQPAAPGAPPSLVIPPVTPPLPPAGEAPQGTPPEGTTPPGGVTPEQMAALQQTWETQRLAGRPATPADYALPAIDGLDANAMNASPVVAELRQLAHDQGLPQDKFAEVLGRYAKVEIERATTHHANEMKALGENAATRLAAVSNWLGTKLQGEELAGVCASLTTAAAVRGIEKLMAGQAPQMPGPPGVPGSARKTQDEIKALMASPEYSNPRKRDPAVVAEVEAWFKAEFPAKPA